MNAISIASYRGAPYNEPDLLLMMRKATMRQRWLTVFANISLSLAGVLLLFVGVRVFAQTSDVNNSAPASAIGSIQSLPRAEIDNLLATTPQLLDIQNSIILAPFIIDPPIGLCELELGRLPNVPTTNIDVLRQTSIPDELVLWRLIPDPFDAPDNAWQENPYVFNPRTESIIFQCFDRATYILFRGTPSGNYNMGLSDAGTLPIIWTAQQQRILLIAGILLILGGSFSIAQRRVQK